MNTDIKQPPDYSRPISPPPREDSDKRSRDRVPSDRVPYNPDVSAIISFGAGYAA